MRLICLLCLAAILLSSCSANFYSPALLGADIAYQPKPMSSDSTKTANYLSGSLIASSGRTYTDELTIGMLDYSRAHVFKHINLSYGAFGFFGNIKNHQLQPDEEFYFQKKSFSGLGFRSSINYYISDGRLDFRVIGLELSGSKEFGQFSKFRKQVLNYPDFYSNPSREVFTAGISSELAWHGKRNFNNNFGLRLFVGKTLSNTNYSGIYTGQEPYGYYDDAEINLALSWFMQIRRYMLTAEAGQSFRLGLGYQF